MRSKSKACTARRNVNQKYKLKAFSKLRTVLPNINLGFTVLSQFSIKRLPPYAAKLPGLPLISIHLTIFQHRRVRTSTWFCPSFILIKIRSLGFGSKICDHTILSLWLQIFVFNLATYLKSPAHSSTSTRSELKAPSTVCKLSLS